AAQVPIYLLRAQGRNIRLVAALESTTGQPSLRGVRAGSAGLEIETGCGVDRQVLDAPSLDGTLDGFDPGEPLVLDHEDQYRRSEQPYAGPEEFSASAIVNWNDEALFLAVDVIKPELFP